MYSVCTVSLTAGKRDILKICLMGEGRHSHEEQIGVRNNFSRIARYLRDLAHLW